MKSFYDNITIRHFEIKGWIYRGILEVLVKKSLNLISFPPIPPNFRGNENLRFWGFAWEFIREWNGIELIHFITILLLDPYFKINN